MERFELQSAGPFGYINRFQFRRLAIGFTLVLPALFFGALTVDGILDLVAGRHLDHLVPRILGFIVAVFSATFAIGLIGRTVRELRYTLTGMKAQGTITAISHEHGRWNVTYRFQDRQGNRREGRFVTYAPEFAVGDEGDVCYADGWDGSLWMSMSERELPPAR